MGELTSNVLLTLIVLLLKQIHVDLKDHVKNADIHLLPEPRRRASVGEPA